MKSSVKLSLLLVFAVSATMMFTMTVLPIMAEVNDYDGNFCQEGDTITYNEDVYEFSGNYVGTCNGNQADSIQGESYDIYEVDENTICIQHAFLSNVCNYTKRETPKEAISGASKTITTYTPSSRMVCSPKEITEEVCREQCLDLDTYENGTEYCSEGYGEVCRNNTYTVQTCTRTAFSYNKYIEDEKGSGNYSNVTDVVDFEYKDNMLVLSWWDKVVYLKPYIEYGGEEWNFSDDWSIAMALEKPTKDDLSFRTSIIDSKDSYYYNHTMDVKVGKETKESPEVSKFGYRIEKTNANCRFDDNRLVCDEVMVDFGGAAIQQNFTIHKEESLKEAQDIAFTDEKSTLDLSYIDPTVMLQDADTEVLEDSWIDDQSTDSNHGTEDSLYIGDSMLNMNYTTWIKFNQTPLNNYSSLYYYNATLVLERNGLISSGNIDIFKSTNKTWHEDELTWNTQDLDSITTYLETEYISSTDIFDVSSAVDPNGDNITFVLNKSTTAPGGAVYDSKECTTTSNRPYLNVTFFNTSNITTSGCIDLDIPNGTYYLDSDITDSSTTYCMNISAQNVTLDCQGHIIDGDGLANYGIYVDGNNQDMNTIIKNCTLTDWDIYGISLSQAYNVTLDHINISTMPDTGIRVYESIDSVIKNTNVSSCTDYGISFWESANNTINNTMVYNNEIGIGFNYIRDGETIVNNTNITNSTDFDVFMKAENKSECNMSFQNVYGTGDLPIVYYNNTVKIDGWYNNVSEIVMCGADDSIINNLTMESDYNNNGIFMTGKTSNITIENSTLNGTYHGIHFDYYPSGDFKNNYMENIVVGFYGTNGPQYCNFTNNTIYNATYGFRFYPGHHNYFINNNMTGISSYGIYIDSGDNNTAYNNFINTSGTHIFFDKVLSFNFYLNTTKTQGTRIFGHGNEIGGNYYTTPTRNGYSDTCTDSDRDGFCDNSKTWGDATDYLPLSLVAPNVTINYPSNITYTNQSIWFNVTTSRATDVCLENHNGTNYTMSNDSTTHFYLHNDSSILDGAYTVKLYCNDSWGAVNGTETQSFSIHATEPEVTIDSPTNTTYGQNVWFNTTLNEPGSVCLENHNGTNYTMNNDSTTHFYLNNITILQGAYTVTFYCNDSYGNMNGTQTESFTIDTTSPEITVSNPQNTTYDNNSISFNITTNEPLANCSANFDGINHTMTNSSETDYSYFNNSLTDDSYTVYYYCYDPYGNFNGTETASWTVDTTEPEVTLNSPSNLTYDNQSIWFNITLNEPGSACIENHNGTNYTLSNDSSTHWYLHNDSTILDGAYTVAFYCNDSYGNMNGTQTESFTIDTTEPEVTIDSPTNTTYGQNIWFNTTLNEPGSVCLENHNGTNYTMSNDSTTHFYLNNITILQGAYTVAFYCNDSYGNMNGTQTESFTIDATPPEVTILNPANATYNLTHPDIFFQVQKSESGGECLVDFNGTNRTLTNETGLWNYTDTANSIGTGSYTAEYYCDDAYNNYNTTTISFTVDVTPPSITISSPTNTSYDKNLTSINMTIDEDASWCWWNINGTNYTSWDNQSARDWDVQVVSPFQTINLKVYCNDSQDNEGSNTTIWYSVYEIKPSISKGDASQGHAEIGFQTNWSRTDSAENTDIYNYTNAEIHLDVPQDTVAGTVTVVAENGNTCPQSVYCTTPNVNMTEYIVNFTSNITSGDTHTYIVKYNTTTINYTINTQMSGTTWYGYINVTNNITSISDVHCNRSLNESLISPKLYYYTAGSWSERTLTSSWSFETNDTNGDGSDDMGWWVVPSLDALHRMYAGGDTGTSINSTSTDTITNPPVTPFKNIQWQRNITFYNYNPISRSFTEKVRPPADATNIELDDKSVETYWDVKGRYIQINDTISANSNVIHLVTYQTNAITVDTYYNYPEEFWSDEMAGISLNVSLKNWASSNITDIEETVPISYGENLYLCRNFTYCNSSNAIDDKSIISGSFVIEEDEMGGLEVKYYNLTYEIPVANLVEGPKYREQANGSWVNIREYTLKCVSPIPIQNLKTKIEDVNASDVVTVIDSDGNEYEYESGSLVVEFGAVEMNEVIDFRVVSKEEMFEPPELDTGFIKSFLETWIGPLMVWHIILLFSVGALIYVLVKFNVAPQVTGNAQRLFKTTKKELLPDE